MGGCPLELTTLQVAKGDCMWAGVSNNHLQKRKKQDHQLLAMHVCLTLTYVCLTVSISVINFGLLETN